MINLNRQQAEQLLKMFGGEDASVIVQHSDTGHGGPGLYAWFEDYPDEGGVFLNGTKEVILINALGQYPMCCNCDDPLSTPSELDSGECNGCSTKADRSTESAEQVAS